MISLTWLNSPPDQPIKSRILEIPSSNWSSIKSLKLDDLVQSYCMEYSHFIQRNLLN